MKEIKIAYADGRLVLDVAGEEYFIRAIDLLEILDREGVACRFHNLRPEVKYAELETFDKVVHYDALKERGFKTDEIAKRLNVGPSLLDSWEATREEARQQIRDRRPDDYRVLKARMLTRV